MRKVHGSNFEVLPEHVRELLVSQAVVYVSGKPVWHFSADGKERFFGDCDELIEHPLFVVNALLAHIPETGNTHIPEEYRGDYPVITGFSTETGDEIRFGVKSELNFGIVASLIEE